MNSMTTPAVAGQPKNSSAASHGSQSALQADAGSAEFCRPEFWAKRYADRGLGMVALYGIENGQCACAKGADCPSPGKHPVRSGWQSQPARSLEAILP